MKDRIIIMGIAPCLEEDLDAVKGKSLYDFMAIGLDCSDRVRFDIQHATTYHTDEFIGFRERRAIIGGNLNYLTHSHENIDANFCASRGVVMTIDHIWPLLDCSPFSGSSSLLGCQAAIGLGYKKIILCGCPMSGKNPNASVHDYDLFQQGWTKHVDNLQLKKYVRSMSGWTRDFLGAPDIIWLTEL